MIVVAIVGVLAVLAGYGVTKYISNAKSAEATNSLGIMAQDAVAAFERESMAATVLGQKASAGLSRQFCGSVSKTVPASAAAIQGKKYQSNPSEWTVDAAGNSGFACLKFTMDAPQYYMYSYGVSGSGAAGNSFTAQAQGDLNGDGVLSLYQLSGSVTTAMTLAVSPNLLIVRPED
jgi:type IV pilus assembly protein PilA